MDIIKNFYEMVRVQQTFAFFVKANSNEREYIPFIANNTLINTSLKNVLPPSAKTVDRFAKSICTTFYHKDKRLTKCDSINTIGEFGDYLFMFNHKKAKEKILLKRKRLQSPPILEEQDDTKKPFLSETSNVLNATGSAKIKQEQYETLNTLLNEFQEKVKNVRDGPLGHHRSGKDSTNFKNALRNIQTEYKKKFEQHNLQVGENLHILELEEGWTWTETS